jgi:metallo-beta-lactamase class B
MLIMRYVRNAALIIVMLFAIRVIAKDDYKKIIISDNLYLVKISDNSYVHVSTADMGSFGIVASNGLIYINSRHALLCDTPVNEKETKELVEFIYDSLKAVKISFVPNHWHDDCMGGLAYLQGRGIHSYANQMTIDIAKDKKLPVPEFGFSKFLLLKTGNENIICKYHGAGHSTDNIVVYIPSEKILFGGCMVKEMAAKGKGNLSDADLKAWPETIKNVKENYPDARIVIPGHGAFGGRELLDHTLEVLKN